MRKVGGIVLAGSIAGIAMMGCSSSSASSDPFGGTPDFANIQEQFSKPTGSLKGNETAAFNAYAQQQTNSGAALSGFSLGGGASADSYKSFRLQTLGIEPQSGASCNFAANGGGETGSCDCPGGGTITYDLSGLRQYGEAIQKGGKVDATVKFSANACKSADGSESIDGKIFENFRGTVPAGGKIDKTSDFAIVIDAHMTSVTASKGTVKADIDLMISTINGVYSTWYSVQVSDGNVVVSGSWNSATKTGSVTVTDKNGTTTCTATDGKTAVCKGPNGEATITL
jgi:hypothetical protein